MKELPDITKLSWPFNVALAGAIFSVFALIYNTNYIAYGFVTFIYGILGHLADTTVRFWLQEKSWKYAFLYSTQLVLTFLWILILWLFYSLS